MVAAARRRGGPPRTALPAPGVHCHGQAPVNSAEPAHQPGLGGRRRCGDRRDRRDPGTRTDDAGNRKTARHEHLRDNQVARWFAVAVVGLNAIGQMFFIPAYPFWSLLIIAIDIVALWGLCIVRQPREPRCGLAPPWRRGTPWMERSSLPGPAGPGKEPGTPE